MTSGRDHEDLKVELVVAWPKRFEQVEVTAAHGDPAVGDIIITVETGARVLKLDAWEYLDVAEIQAVSPETGHYGTEVTIEGANLLGGGSS